MLGRWGAVFGDGSGLAQLKHCLGISTDSISVVGERVCPCICVVFGDGSGLAQLKRLWMNVASFGVVGAFNITQQCSRSNHRGACVRQFLKVNVHPAIHT